MKKLTIVTRSFYPFSRPSGPISLLRELVVALSKSGIEISVLCVRKPGEHERYMYKGVNIFKYKQTLLTSYRSVLNIAGTDNILFYSSISGINELFLWWAPLKMLTKGKNIFFYQTTNFMESSPAIKLPVRKLLHSFSSVFSASDGIQAYFSKKCSVDTSLLYPGVDTNEYNQQTNSKKLEHIAFFGHIAYVKGTDIFLEIVRKNPNLSYTLCAGSSKSVSDRQIQQDAQKMCGRYKSLTCYPYVEDPLLIMKQCDLILLPYRSAESILGVAQTAIESMSLGIPVIGTRNDALTPIIRDGINGYFAESASDILEKIRRLRNNPQVYQRLCKGAREAATKEFDIQITANKIASIIR